jgi:hypothetical protein
MVVPAGSFGCENDVDITAAVVRRVQPVYCLQSLRPGVAALDVELRR